MDSNVLLVSLPATLALLLKVGIFVYTRLSHVRNTHAHLYLYFLLALSVQNVAEISHFFTLHQGRLPYLEFTVYYIAITIAIGLLLQLAASVSFAENNPRVKAFVVSVYVYAGVLTLLFVFSKLLIADLTPMGVTATRVPGALYGLFEVYAIGGFLGAIGILIYGARRRQASYKQRKAAHMLLAIVPMAAVIITVLVLLRLDIRIVNATIINPIAIGYFLIVTAYAIHNQRLFDIQFYIPWSKLRTRKTAFYQRLRAMVAEIADASSVNHVIGQLADVLRCPVALISGPRPVLATSRSSAEMAMFPLRELRAIDSIVVANEIGDAKPSLHTLMRAHGVAAIVPFHPHSHTAASWLLLGDSFSDHVYTPLDFKMVEQVFDRLGDLFLDKLLFMRSQLHEAREQLQTLQLRLDVSEERNKELQRQMRRIQRQVSTADGGRGKSRRRAEPAAVVALVPKPAVEDGNTLDKLVAEFEARMIEQTLARCGGNQSQAARQLGLRPNTLHYKIERYRLADRKNPERPED